MFIVGSEKSIILQTRMGTNIDNFQCREISQANKNYFEIIESKYRRAIKRTNPSGLYNCHGMAFANRRCFIEDPSQILVILKDDEYKEINQKNVLPGDIIIYFSEGDAEHSGIVVSQPKKPLYIPIVVSKWSSHAEFIHYANDCPYDCTNIKYFRVFE